MAELTPDQEWESVTHPERPAGPAQKREMDSLAEQIGMAIDGLGKANKGIEGVRKSFVGGIWPLIVALVAGVWFLSQFVASYQSAMSNGSPAMLTMKGELQTAIASIKKTDDDRYDTLNAILVQLKANNDLTDRRLTRLEDKGK